MQVCIRCKSVFCVLSWSHCPVACPVFQLLCRIAVETQKIPALKNAYLYLYALTTAVLTHAVSKPMAASVTMLSAIPLDIGCGSFPFFVKR